MYKLSPKNYSYVWILGIVFLGLLPAGTAHAGTLSCSITTAAACTGGTNTIILRMSGTTNAHAELPAQTNYTTSVVCCSGVTGLGNSCSGTTATVLRLAGVTNAHSEENSQANAAYTSNACISVSAGSVSVGYAAGVTCASLGYDTTLASMSGITNAHVGNSAAYAGIQICATAAGTPPPTLTTYTNSTEAGLIYAGSCTGCGARIGTGGAKQTVVITGTNFGAVTCGTGNCSTATNNIKIGAHQIADGNISSWTNTSITFSTDTNISGDADSNWSAEFGGAAALKVTAGGAASAGLNFYMFPQVTGVRACDSVGFPVLNNGREYNAGDAACPNGLTDGEVFLDGTRFGTSATGGSVTIVGITATTGSWSNTLIKAQVSPSIADSTYTGNLIVQQGAGSNFKTHTFTTTGFRVLPRITSLSPTSGSSGDIVTVNGNHLCESGTCPGSLSAADKVAFTSADATFFGSWTHTAIGTKAPTGATTGNVVVTSNTTYTSNGSSFSIISPTPSNPTSLNQYKNSGLTTALAIGASASSTPIYITMTMQAGLSGGTLYPQVEYQPIGTGFACSGTSACGTATEGTGVAGPGPIDCSDIAKACAIAVSPADNNYHWQARVRHNKSGTDYYSAWVSFGGNFDPSDTDIKIDTTPPAITAISSTVPTPPGSNSATITWSTSGEPSTSQVQYQAVPAASCPSFSFATACSTNNDCTAINATPVYSPHTTALANLNSGTDYCFRVRSKDAAGNESISSNNSFQTQSVNQPAKTVETLIASNVTASATNYFTLVVPETAPAVKSAYVEVLGLVSGGSNPITLQVNGLTALNYAMNASNPTFVRMLYKVADQNTTVNESLLNFNDVIPCTNHSGGGGVTCNNLVITPGSGMSLYIFSAKFIMTYGYTP